MCILGEHVEFAHSPHSNFFCTATGKYLFHDVQNKGGSIGCSERQHLRRISSQFVEQKSVISKPSIQIQTYKLFVNIIVILFCIERNQVKFPKKLQALYGCSQKLKQTYWVLENKEQRISTSSPRIQHPPPPRTQPLDEGSGSEEEMWGCDQVVRPQPTGFFISSLSSSSNTTDPTRLSNASLSTAAAPILDHPSRRCHLWLPIKTSADSSLLSALLLSGVISQQSNRNYKMILSCRKLPK